VAPEKPNVGNVHFVEAAGAVEERVRHARAGKRDPLVAANVSLGEAAVGHVPGANKEVEVAHAAARYTGHRQR